MITGADIKAGYGQKREKPYNSILPYLRAKQAEKEEAGKKPASPKVADRKETYAEVIHNIVSEE